MVEARTKPLISVVIPTYNCGRYLSECISSVLNQVLDGFELEVIVLDNASTDETRGILEEMSDPRLKCLSNSVTIPAHENWSLVSEMSKGDYVKLLPADDFLEPDSLQSQASCISSNPGVVMVASSRSIVTNRGIHLPSFLGTLALTGHHSGSQAKRASISKAGNIFGEPGSVLFRKSVLAEVLPWPSSAGYVIDLAMYFRVLNHGDFIGLRAIHSSFRLSTNSWSNKVRGQQTSDLINFIQGSEEFKNLRFRIFHLARLVCVVNLKTYLRLVVNLYAKYIDRT